MDCPQCGAEVPSDDAFCGKCGYARRDQTPDRLDQSRIRVHESPGPPADDGTSRTSSRQRVRKQTVLGLQAGTPPAGVPTPAPIPSPPPTPISSARQERTPGRTPKKTMIGMRPLEPIAPAAHRVPPGQADSNPDLAPGQEQCEGSEPAAASHRVRARVCYDSANEPLPVVQRRVKALRTLGVLVVFAAAWLGYRYLTLNG
jgi:hypothetical protein